MSMGRRVRPPSAAGALTVGIVLASACTAPDGADPSLDDVPELAYDEVTRIGSVDDPDIGFSRILRVDVADGEIYVLEVQDMQIRVYGEDGALRRHIGRRGEGPGEFERVARFGVVGDTVWTFDLAGNRITLFDRQGDVLSTGRAADAMIPTWRAGCLGHVIPREMRPDGLFTSSLSRLSCSRNNENPALSDEAEVPVPRLLFDATGAIVDTIGWDDRPPPRMARPPSQEANDFNMIEVGGRPFLVPQRPTQLPDWVYTPDGRIEIDVPQPTSQPASFTLTRIDVAGDTVYRRTILYTAEPFTDEDLDVLAAEASGGMMVGPSTPDPAVQARLRAEMDFPELRPATQGAQLDADGRLWLRRYDPGGSTARWVVVDADGDLLGRLTLPRGFQLMWSEGTTVWGVEHDELDVPWLVRYEMTS